MKALCRCALVLMLGTLACKPLGSVAPSTQAAGTSCEYIGVRFVPPSGWSVKEESDGEPLSRITLHGSSGGHQVLASLFARETLPSAERTPSSQAHAYFQKFQVATASEPFTDFIETTFEDAARTYPALGYRERLPGPIPAMDVQQETIVLLVFPSDFPTGGYFYPIFWTDSHLASAPAGSLAELQALVQSLSVKSPPVGATAKGCGLP
ncbi:MAG: hypothetical protein E6H87_06330 [Chloroflexi bacterium]|nr:MAG: hypothetical protein E6I54_12360 [Chloroflexota bacterium]TMG61455.1 MAG: hypothetical protein E6H87_06330 [Chloroflexota bacterium]